MENPFSSLCGIPRTSSLTSPSFSSHRPGPFPAVKKNTRSALSSPSTQLPVLIQKQRLRPMSYSKSHVILIAFAIDTPDSLDNVTVKVPPPTFSTSQYSFIPPPQWIEEVRSICGPTIPVILVGCKSDLRPSNTQEGSQQFVTRAQAERVAQAIGARAYKGPHSPYTLVLFPLLTRPIECSALKIEGVDDVFEAATRASMLMREGVGGSGYKRHSHNHSGAAPYEGDGWEDKGKCCVVS